MLSARSASRKGQRGTQAEEGARQSGERVTKGGQYRSYDQNSPAPVPFCESAGGPLQPRHRCSITRAQYRERFVAETELGLPDGQQHIHEVGVAIMQRVSNAGGPQGTAAKLDRRY